MPRQIVRLAGQDAFVAVAGSLEAVAVGVADFSAESYRNWNLRFDLLVFLCLTFTHGLVSGSSFFLKLLSPLSVGHDSVLEWLRLGNWDGQTVSARVRVVGFGLVEERGDFVAFLRAILHLDRRQLVCSSFDADERHVVARARLVAHGLAAAGETQLAQHARALAGIAALGRVPFLRPRLTVVVLSAVLSVTLGLCDFLRHWIVLSSSGCVFVVL